MVAYKLVRQMKDGSLSPLFINKKSRLSFGVWLKAENHPTKGFKERMGWHCTLEPKAPHLKIKPKNGRPRIWVEVEVKNYKKYKRPESQGGMWVLANQIKINKVL